MPRKWLWFSVSLPALAVVLGILRAETHTAGSDLWQFAIRGFDPRDLLRGHYLAFRLNLHPQNGKAACARPGECCLCLARTTANEPPEVHYQTCSGARLKCNGVLREQYASEILRYYVPEARAMEAERRLQQAADKGSARVILAVDPAGNARVEDLLVGGEPILP